MTPREQAVIDTAHRVNESVRSMGGPDDRLFLESGPLEDLATALDELKAEQEQAPMGGRGGGEQFERTAPVTGATEEIPEYIHAAAKQLRAAALEHVRAVVPVGYSVVRNQDVLNAEDRAAIGRYLSFNGDGDDPATVEFGDQEGDPTYDEDVARLTRLANGGQS